MSEEKRGNLVLEGFVVEVLRRCNAEQLTKGDGGRHYFLTTLCLLGVWK